MQRLPDRWISVLRDAPEVGMGYSIVTVRTANGNLFEHVVVDSGFIVKVAGYADIPFRADDIIEMVVTNDRSRYVGSGSKTR